MLLKRRQEIPQTAPLAALEPALVVLDAKGNVQLFSAGAEALFGMRLARVQQLGFGQCIPCPREYGGNLTAYLCHYCESTENLWLQPLTAYRYDGTRFTLVFRAAPLLEVPGSYVFEFVDASKA